MQESAKCTCLGLYKGLTVQFFLGKCFLFLFPFFKQVNGIQYVGFGEIKPKYIYFLYRA